MFRLPRLNVVMLGLFQVALHLVLLRDVFVGVVQEFLFDGPKCLHSPPWNQLNTLWLCQNNYGKIHHF